MRLLRRTPEPSGDADVTRPAIGGPLTNDPAPEGFWWIQTPHRWVRPGNQTNEEDLMFSTLRTVRRDLHLTMAGLRNERATIRAIDREAAVLSEPLGQAEEFDPEYLALVAESNEARAALPWWGRVGI